MAGVKKISNELNFIAVVIISILPLIFILGSGLLNLFIIVIDLIFLFEIFLNRNFKYFKNNFFYSLILLWLILIINLFFSISFLDSLSRCLGFIRFVFFAFAINYYFYNSDKNKKLILKIWTISFLIITFDLIYEYIFGFNTLGFKSYMPGRLSGFFNQELKIGHLYSAFLLSSLSFIYIYLNKIYFKKNSPILYIKKNIIYFLFILFLFVSFIVGERSNLIKITLMMVIFLFFFEKKFFLKKILIIFLSVTILISIVLNNQNYKYRLWTMFLEPLIENPVLMVKNSNYGAHYKVALEVFNNNKFFGVGLKNYRKEVTKDIYSNNASIHPHQLHFEILSETGLFGYCSFLLFFIYNLSLVIKNYLKTKNIFQLSGILFVFVSLLPLIPSGSFFTSFGAALFWLNFGLMLPKRN
tara:strand:- start:533 stop:1771 length:1239 start_codon:yes stop_codon:yes gene_type:complete